MDIKRTNALEYEGDSHWLSQAIFAKNRRKKIKIKVKDKKLKNKRRNKVRVDETHCRRGVIKF